MVSITDPLQFVAEDFAQKMERLQENVHRLKDRLTADHVLKIIEALIRLECKKRLAQMLLSQNDKESTAIDKMVRARLEYNAFRTMAIMLNDIFQSKPVDKIEEELQDESIEEVLSEA